MATPACFSYAQHQMKALDELASTLRRIDGRGYKAYKSIAGGYATRELELYVDHVQGDPFAAPSRLRAHIPHQVAGFPEALRASKIRRIALADFVARAFAREAHHSRRRRGSGKSGEIGIDEPGQQVLERTACLIDDAGIEIRFSLGLPAAGRRVLAREAETLLLRDVPSLIERAAQAESHDLEQVDAHVRCVEDARALRDQVERAGLVAFVANGSILPRRSGIDPRPMDGDQAVAFRSPSSLEVSFELPNAGSVTGMGIPEGVTLIVGGGYHGKSTLLSALELGVYEHRPGDGRERVVSDARCVKIRAEDGRRVERVDISPFIDNLPRGQDTTRFCSEDASGSTSQAANVMEALEAGAKLLLIDEDTAATNFMIRDHRMQQLVSKDREPITPFVDRVRQLHQEHGVSTIVVVGGSGDYFDVADRVIAMHDYLPEDVTDRAKEIAAQPTGREREGGTRFGPIAARTPKPSSIDASKGRRQAKIVAQGTRTIRFGKQEIDMTSVGQLVANAQLNAIGQTLHHAKSAWMDGRSVSQLLDAIDEAVEARGLDAIDDRKMGSYARFRRFELAAALNRLRTLRMR